MSDVRFKHGKEVDTWMEEHELLRSAVSFTNHPAADVQKLTRWQKWVSLTNLRIYEQRVTVAEIFMMATDVLTSQMWGKVMRDLAEDKMDHSKEKKITANIQ